MRFGRVAAVAVLLAAGCSATVSGTGQVGAACAPVFFGVAGSGQGVENPPPAGRPAGVSEADADQYGTAIGLLKTDLVRRAAGRLAATEAIDYPAISIEHYAGAAGLTGNLDLSEGIGVRNLARAIMASERGRCLGRPVLLAGYSQGAEVVIRAVNALTPQQRSGVAVAMFGNPSYQPGVLGDYPGGTVARGIRPSFRGVAYALPADVRARTLDVCAPGDPVCGMDPRRTTIIGKLAYIIDNANVHITAYAFGSAGYAAKAAAFLWRYA
jgi:hypothetical protein